MSDKLKTALFFLGLLLIGGSLGYLLGTTGADLLLIYYSDAQLLAMLLLSPVVYLLVIGVHEGGHLLAGWLNSFEFQGIIVGPFAWERQGRSIRLRWNRRLNLSGGLVLMVPRDDAALRRRFIRYVAGGPLASLLLAVTGMALFCLLPGAGSGGLFMGCCGLLSLFIGLATILPAETGGFSSDGRRILILLRDNDQSRAELLMLRCITAQQAGFPPAGLPAEDIRAVLALPGVDGVYRGLLHYYLYLFHLDRREIDPAGKELHRMEGYLPAFATGIRERFYGELAFFAAYYRRDPVKARSCLKRFSPGPFISETALRLTRAAVLELENKPDLARGELSGLQEKVSDSMEKGKQHLYRQWIAGLQARLDNGRNQTTVR